MQTVTETRASVNVYIYLLLATALHMCLCTCMWMINTTWLLYASAECFNLSVVHDFSGRTTGKRARIYQKSTWRRLRQHTRATDTNTQWRRNKYSYCTSLEAALGHFNESHKCLRRFVWPVSQFVYVAYVEHGLYFINRIFMCGHVSTSCELLFYAGHSRQAAAVRKFFSFSWLNRPPKLFPQIEKNKKIVISPSCLELCYLNIPTTLTWKEKKLPLILLYC